MILLSKLKFLVIKCVQQILALLLLIRKNQNFKSFNNNSMSTFVAATQKNSKKMKIKSTN